MSFLRGFGLLAASCGLTARALAAASQAIVPAMDDYNISFIALLEPYDADQEKSEEVISTLYIDAPRVCVKHRLLIAYRQEITSRILIASISGKSFPNSFLFGGHKQT